MLKDRPLVASLVSACAIAVLTPTAAWAQYTDETLSSSFPEFQNDEVLPPEVLTTTRLRQSKTRVPGTTTIITGDMIRDLGVMNLVEVFRLVPGMVVAEVGSNTPVTSYHGTVHYEQRRLQIQVDGRTAYRASLSDMDWIAMPVALELIERIEVSRGPNSAAYGINAFLASINIITRSPADTAGVEAYTSVGSRGHLRTFTSVGDANQDGSWRLAYEKRKSNGFDTQVEGGEEIPFHDGYNTNNVNFDSILKLAGNNALELRAGVVDGVNQEDQFKSGKLGATTNPDIVMDDYYLQTRFDGYISDDHFYHVQVSYQNQKRRQRWSVEIPANEFAAILPPGSPSFPTNQGPFVADLNEDIEESRLEFEVQDTLIFTPNLKLVSGLGYREDTYRSETFFNGRGHNYQGRAFGNLEYSPSRWLTLNAGGNYETTTTTHENYFSPRVAANFIFNNNHALRFVFSRAVRTPDAFEQDPDWSYTARNVQPPFQALENQRFLVEDLVQTLSDRPSTFGEELEEEHITSREISYFGQFNLDTALLLVEVRYFNDDLDDMISGVINEEDWFIDNNVALEQEGFELETSLELAGTTLRATYGYLHQRGQYTGDPNKLVPDDQEYVVDLLGRLSARHSGSVAWIQELPMGFSGAAVLYWTDEFRRDQFERADFRISRRIDQPTFSYELALTMQHYLVRDPATSPDNIIEDHNQFFVEAGIRF